jgi:hypothetical protein
LCEDSSEPIASAVEITIFLCEDSSEPIASAVEITTFCEDSSEPIASAVEITKARMHRLCCID